MIDEENEQHDADFEERHEFPPDRRSERNSEASQPRLSKFQLCFGLVAVYLTCGLVLVGIGTCRRYTRPQSNTQPALTHRDWTLTDRSLTSGEPFQHLRLTFKAADGADWEVTLKQGCPNWTLWLNLKKGQTVQLCDPGAGARLLHWHDPAAYVVPCSPTNHPDLIKARPN
jgi:hypothetical protein